MSVKLQNDDDDDDSLYSVIHIDQLSHYFNAVLEPHHKLGVADSLYTRLMEQFTKLTTHRLKTNKFNILKTEPRGVTAMNVLRYLKLQQLIEMWSRRATPRVMLCE